MHTRTHASHLVVVYVGGGAQLHLLGLHAAGGEGWGGVRVGACGGGGERPPRREPQRGAG